MVSDDILSMSHANVLEVMTHEYGMGHTSQIYQMIMSINLIIMLHVVETIYG
jgi:hypothetical protein